MKKYDKIKQLAGLALLLVMCLASYDCLPSKKNANLEDIGANGVKLSWERVYSKGVEASYQVAKTSRFPNEYSFHDYETARNQTGLTADKAYTFKVRARTPNGKIDDNFKTVTVTTKPWYDNTPMPKVDDFVVDENGVRVLFKDQWGNETSKYYSWAGFAPNVITFAISSYLSAQSEARLHNYLGANFRALARLITQCAAEIIEHINDLQNTQIRAGVDAVRTQADLYFARPIMEERGLRYWIRSKEYSAEAANLQEALLNAMSELTNFYHRTDVYTIDDLKFVHQTYLSLAGLLVALQLDLARGEYYYHLNDNYNARDSASSKKDAARTYYNHLQGTLGVALGNMLSDIKELDQDWGKYRDTKFSHGPVWFVEGTWNVFEDDFLGDTRMGYTYEGTLHRMNGYDCNLYTPTCYVYSPSDRGNHCLCGSITNDTEKQIGVFPNFSYVVETYWARYSGYQFSNGLYLDEVLRNEKKLHFHYLLEDIYKPTRKMIEEYWLRFYEDAGGSANDFANLLVVPDDIAEVMADPPIIPSSCPYGYHLEYEKKRTCVENAWNVVAPAPAVETNLAREPGVRVSQSSTGWGGDARRAVDGNADGRYWSRSVTHTANGKNSRWLADLGETWKISRIILHNRSDCCWSRLGNFRVSALDEAGKEVWGKNYFVGSGSVARGGSHTVALPADIFARSVRVQFLGFNNDGNGYLSLAEVKIIGEKKSSSHLTDLAREPGVRVSQSSTGWGGDARRAVDGNADGRYWSGSVTHTANGSNSYWRADLDGTYEINRITLYNRSDCCWSRLSNFRVSLLDKDGEEVWGKNYFVGSGSVAQGDSHTVYPPFPTFGRSVMVRFLGVNNDGDGYLSLAEVQIIGKK